MGVAPFFIGVTAPGGSLGCLFGVKVSRHCFGKILDGVEVPVYPAGGRRRTHPVPEDLPGRAPQVQARKQQPAAGGFGHLPGETPAIGGVPAVSQLVGDGPGGEPGAVEAGGLAVAQAVLAGALEEDAHREGPGVKGACLAVKGDHLIQKAQFALVPVAGEGKTCRCDLFCHAFNCTCCRQGDSFFVFKTRNE